MNLRIEISEVDLKALVQKYLSDKIGVDVELKDVRIETPVDFDVGNVDHFLSQQEAA